MSTLMLGGLWWCGQDQKKSEDSVQTIASCLQKSTQAHSVGASTVERRQIRSTMQMESRSSDTTASQD